TFRARGATKDAGDALELRVPIAPRAVTLRSGGGGVTEGGSRTVTVPLPAGLLADDSRVTLDLSPSPAAMALAGVQYLVTYPWGCAEQTSNTILPASAVLEALRKTGATLPGWETPGERFAPGVRRLLALQMSDGGWGWWGDSDFEPYLTALAL